MAATPLMFPFIALQNKWARKIMIWLGDAFEVPMQVDASVVK